MGKYCFFRGYMMSLLFNFTCCGNRKINLDRTLHINCESFSVSLIMDGFGNYSGDKHYVDYIFDKIYLEIKNKSNIDVACGFILDLLNEKNGFDGKSTISIIIYDKYQLRYLSIGDTRIYFLKNRLKTKDNSLAQKLIDDGISPISSLRTHPYKNKLCEFISREKTNEKIFFSKLEVENNEKIIICSDGFWRIYTDDEIWEMDDALKIKNRINDIKENSSMQFDNISILLLCM